MADHIHKQIRSAVATACAGLTTTGSRVYANRLYPLEDANLPALRIYLDDESASVESIHAPMLQSRRLSIVVECCAKATNALDDTCDQMSKEVETAIAAGITVAGQTLYPEYAGMEFEDEIADKPAAAKRLRYELNFYTTSNAPDALA